MGYRTTAAVAKIKADALRVAASGNDLILTGPKGGEASLTNWSFGQVAERAKAPAAYLKTLPASIAADCLNDGLRRHKGPDAQLLVSKNPGTGLLSARAVTSDKYSRIWNADITKRLLELEAKGPWQPAPAAFDGSRGLYLGDRDMFAFLVDNERRIFETGPGGGLSRGFFCWNSEVGDASFGIMTFLYEYVCGNHRVWGVQNVNEARIIHIGRDQSSKALEMMTVEVRKYAEVSSADDEAKVLSARRYQIGAEKTRCWMPSSSLKRSGDHQEDRGRGLRARRKARRLVRLAAHGLGLCRRPHRDRPRHAERERPSRAEPRRHEGHGNDDLITTGEGRKSLPGFPNGATPRLIEDHTMNFHQKTYASAARLGNPPRQGRRPRARPEAKRHRRAGNRLAAGRRAHGGNRIGSLRRGQRPPAVRRAGYRAASGAAVLGVVADCDRRVARGV